MLDLREAAKFARNRIDKRLEAAESQKKGLPRSAAIVEQGSSFRVRIKDAMQRGGDERQSPSPAPVTLYLAFPEKLLAKWYYLAFGPQRIDKSGGPHPTPESEWKTWDVLGEDTAVVNFARTDPKAVLVAHGLSAIDDSIFLLAELGRSFRAARALEVDVNVLLAGTNWISYNRSLKKFNLSDDEIQSGLFRCQDRRLRLYEALGAQATVHEIVGHAKKGAISSKKIQMIANRYVELAGIIWGKDILNTEDVLPREAVAKIGRALPVSIGDQSPLQVLAQFPGALHAMEGALAPHLSVVRTIAQRFRLLGLDTFSYYFAQYYAQDGYRGTHIKIAPASERSFDEPFDELDDSFQSWGEGHEPGVDSKSKRSARRRRLAAVYLPQYRIGDWELLPYTPLSISAVSQAGGNISTVIERVILISDNKVNKSAKIEDLLRKTLEKAGAARLNRLIYDVLSFIQTAIGARGKGALDDVCRKLGFKFEDVLSEINEQLPHFFSIECEDSAVLGDLWLSWLDAIEHDRAPNYIPCHIFIATFTSSDWTAARLSASGALLMIANALATDLST